MRYAILSLAAAAALALSAGTASAQPPGYYYGNRPVVVRPVVVAPSYAVYPAFPSYGYSGSNFGITIGGPRGIVSFNSFNTGPAFGFPNYGYSGFGYPSYGYGYTPRPYYGGFYGPRW